MSKHFRIISSVNDLVAEKRKGINLPAIIKVLDSGDVVYLDEYCDVAITATETIKSGNLRIFYTEDDYNSGNQKSQGLNARVNNLRYEHAIYRFGFETLNGNGTYSQGLKNISKIKFIGSVYDATRLLDRCTDLEEVDVEYLDTRRNKSLLAAFQALGKITTLNVGNFRTEKVETIAYVFNKCSSLAEIIGVGHWNTGKVMNMYGAFQDCTALASLDLSMWDVSNVMNETSYMFTNCHELTTVGDLAGWRPINVSKMTSMFSGCSNLKTIGDISLWNPSHCTSMANMFKDCKELEDDMDLSKWNMANVANTMEMFEFCQKVKHFALPDSLKVINSFMFNHNIGCMDEELTIPKATTTIGASHAFYDFGKDGIFKRFIVSNGNTAFKTDDYGILYSADGSRLVSVPRAVELPSTTFQIPEGVTFMGDLSFSRVHTINTLILPDSYEIERNVTKNSGNISAQQEIDGAKIYANYGNSLTVAVYAWTSISEYEVKNTNPNYMSWGGCIYSKDGTELIAVPTRYNGALVIRSGCTKIGVQAFWESDDSSNSGWEYTYPYGDARGLHITSISIPASVTEITDNQLAVLNAMVDGYPTDDGHLGENKVTISINPNNGKYYINAQGKIVKKLNV